MKKTRKSTGGTSFHNTVVVATVEQLRAAMGEPEYEHNYGDDKVNFEWEMETEAGQVFTVYDWKEYRPISEQEPIEWHIGGMSRIVTQQALIELTAALSKTGK